jgi:uncharacterized protein YegL
MREGLTELVFILDKSGSMNGLEKDTIGGFNTMLEEQKGAEGECLVTTVMFNDRCDLVHDRADIKTVSPITESDYRAAGTTALIDAIGATIHRVVKSQKTAPEGGRAEKVVFVIITDGEENSSREYSAGRVKGLIEKEKSRYGWDFIFLGANIDAVQTAGRFGIDSRRAQGYHADSQGVGINYCQIGRALLECRRGDLPDDWNEEIDLDFKKRRKSR